MSLQLKTAELIKRNIIALLTGAAKGVDPDTGKLIETNKTTDPFKINPADYSSTYTDEFSVGRHLVSKQKLVEYKTDGLKQNVELKQDEVTELPKYAIKIAEQDERELEESSEEGDVPNQELDVINSKTPYPTDFSNDQYLQTIINSLAVSIANSVSEALINTLVSKIEKNLTEIEIKFNPAVMHQIRLLNATGAISQTSMAATDGTIALNGTYKHKCKIKISE